MAPTLLSELTGVDPRGKPLERVRNGPMHRRVLHRIHFDPWCARTIKEEQMSWASKLAKPYRIDHGKKFRLKDFDPADTGNHHSKEEAEALLSQGVASLAELQDKLYAQDRWGILVIFQGMDAAGKDGLVK